MVGMRNSKIIKCLGHQVNGYHNMIFTKKDMYKFIASKWQANINGGDACKVLGYFEAKHANDPNFYYKYETNENH